jgi:peptidoglycan/xylan/chitin deacetylase (PgdA/CDA1 family)
VLVLTRPVDNATDAASRLAGLLRMSKRRDATALRLDGSRAPAARAFDSPEERLIPLVDAAVRVPPEVILLEPDPGAGTTVVGEALSGDAPLGAVLTRRPLGKGAIYALGHNLFSFDHYRCYVNCFEPSGDLFGLFLREAFREGSLGHLVLKHTVPGLADSVLLVTHDVDAPEAQNAGYWGKAGALQMAEVERAHGVRGTFFITTDYVSGYYNEGMVRELCADGMCPVGAHSVRHGGDLITLPEGTCNETFASYPPTHPSTLCGEVRVSQELLERATGSPVRSWRSPYLDLNPALYDVLAQQGFLADSSLAVGDLKVNLPVSAARWGLLQDRFHHQPLHTFPIALEDGIGARLSTGEDTREELQNGNFQLFMSLWKYTLLRNAANQAFTTLLVHPSGGLALGAQNLPAKVRALDAILTAARERGLQVEAIDRIAEFWRGREGVDVDARYRDRAYEGQIRTGALPVAGLTLEFGDVIAGFRCERCGAATVSGKRVVLAATLPPAAALNFVATVQATP